MMPWAEQNKNHLRSLKKICLVLAAVLLIFYAVGSMLDNGEQITEHVVSASTVGEITSERTVVQTVEVPTNKLYGFSLRFATYNKAITSTVHVVLRNKAEQTVFEQTFNASVLKDNHFYTFRFPEPLNHTKGETFDILISSPDATNGNAVTIWSSAENSYPAGELTVNGTPLESSDLSFQLFHSTVASPLPWSVVLGFLVLFVLVLLLWIWVISPKQSSEQCYTYTKVCAWVLSALFFSFALASMYTIVFHKINSPSLLNAAASFFGIIFSLSNLLRAVVLLPVALLVTAMLLWNVRYVLQVGFAKRWLIALGVFVLYVIVGINFSNVGAFHNIVQPGTGDDLMAPLFGMVRGIRSDEWLVNMPFYVSTEHAGYGEFNEILRGAMNYNLPSTGLYLSYSALSDPLNFGYFLFGAHYGASFYWCASMLLSIMLSLEFAYILSGKSKIMALLGIALIAMSPFNLWWSICTLMTGFMGILVCTYYCFQVEKFYQRCLCILGVAMSGAFFICQLYPAWQVPMAYILIPLFLWIVIDHFHVLRSFRLKEWLVAGAAIAFMGSIVLSYLMDIQDYTASIMGTVYPGERFETGGYSLAKNLSFIQIFQLPFRDITVGSNNSEAGIFFSLFPLPTIIAVYVLLRQIAAKIKNRSEKIDLLNALLLIPAIFLAVFCTIGIPDWLAKITLMSYSPANRASDWLAFIDLIFLIRHASGLNKYKLPVPVAAGLVGAVVATSILQSQKMCPGYMIELYVIGVSALALIFGVACFAKIPEQQRKTALVLVALVAILLGAAVSPVNSGIGSLTQKPAALKIQEIAQKDPQAKWIGYGNIIVGQYAIANGAPCITSTNYIPNMELWTKLDPCGQYNEVYNRYSHISLNFTDGQTKFSLLGPDHMMLLLSYEDIAKTDCKYIFALAPLTEDSDAVDFRLLYNESNAFIYEIIYL